MPYRAEHAPHVHSKSFSGFLHCRHHYGKLLLSNAQQKHCASCVAIPHLVHTVHGLPVCLYHFRFTLRPGFLSVYTTSGSRCACLTNLPLCCPRVAHDLYTALFFLQPQPNCQVSLRDFLPITHISASFTSGEKFALTSSLLPSQRPSKKDKDRN